MKTVSKDEGDESGTSSSQAKDEILEEGSTSHLAFAAAQAAALSPTNFVAAATHDISKQILKHTPGIRKPDSKTAADQFQAEHNVILEQQDGVTATSKSRQADTASDSDLQQEVVKQQNDSQPSDSELSKPQNFKTGSGPVSRLLRKKKGPLKPNLAGHYNVKDDAVLLCEAITPQQTRVLFIFVWTSVALGFALLIWSIIDKIRAQDTHTRRVVKKEDFVRVIGGGVCLLVMLLCFSLHAKQLILMRLRGKVWKRRRHIYTMMVFTESCLQLVILLTVLVPNIISLKNPCNPSKSRGLGAGVAWIINWTCFNTIFLLALIQAHSNSIVPIKKGTGQGRFAEGSLGIQALTHIYRDTKIVFDLPFIPTHLPKMILWCGLEAVLISAFIVVRHQDRHDDLQGQLEAIKGSKCPIEHTPLCHINIASKVLFSVALLITLVYFLAFAYYLRRLVLQLRLLCYQAHKINNLLVRLQLTARIPTFGLFFISAVVIWNVRPLSCQDYLQTFLGLLPLNVALTASTVGVTFIALPIDVRQSFMMLNVWLQEFVWLERDLEPSRVNRDTKVPPEHRTSLQKEPMFSVETSMVALYWSLLVYDYEEAKTSQLSMEEGQQMFSPPLTDSELMWDKVSDTKMLIGWNRETIVLAFRGTASFSNVFADLQAWQTAHVPRRGHLFWNQPRVHAGFQRCYTLNDFGKQMLEKIRSIALANEVDLDKMPILVTGHSLGGALATLAAFDISRYLLDGADSSRLQAYTFGAPRTGNHSFASEFQAKVPDCWNIINDQDVVARRTKFLSLYKLGGHKVVINMKGDLVVRPTAAEASVRVVPCSGSVTQHLLTNYMSSMLMIVLAQFCSKSVAGGAIGAYSILQSHAPWKRWLLQKTGLTVGDLVALQSLSFKQSGDPEGVNPQQDLQSLHSQLSLGSEGSVQSLGSDGSPSLPSGLSRKLDRFIRQGLSQDALESAATKHSDGTADKASTRGTFGCSGNGFCCAGKALGIADDPCSCAHCCFGSCAGSGRLSDSFTSLCGIKLPSESHQTAPVRTQAEAKDSALSAPGVVEAEGKI